LGPAVSAHRAGQSPAPQAASVLARLDSSPRQFSRDQVAGCLFELFAQPRPGCGLQSATPGPSGYAGRKHRAQFKSLPGST
jgi:hypothetical protein